jgi:hypothetical protein
MPPTPPTTPNLYVCRVCCGPTEPGNPLMADGDTSVHRSHLVTSQLVASAGGPAIPGAVVGAMEQLRAGARRDRAVA